jgi:multiple sugar transport system ATP-binding protein
VNPSVSVSLKQLGFSYPGAMTPTLSAIDLHFEASSFVVLVGESGCGKSTLLRLLAGLERPSEGSIFFDDREVTTLEPKARDVAMVFQSYALYPHMNVGENLAFPLKVTGASADETSERVGEIARMLRLDSLLKRRPAELSGGQRQRVAIGRAMVRKPSIFLFDEPLSNLDANLRNQMRAELAERHNELGVTTVYVTHDQVEAMTLADKIALLRDGAVEQFDTPQGCFERPQTAYVAGFFGQPPATLLAGTLKNGRLHIGDCSLPVDVPLTRDSGEVIAGLRSHALRPAPDGILRMHILEREYTGAEVRLHGFLVGHNEARLSVTLSVGEAAQYAGDELALNLQAGSLLVFDATSQATLRSDHGAR